MSAIHRPRAGIMTTRLAMGAALLLVAACGSGTGSSAPASSVAAVATTPPSTAAGPTAAPTRTPRPTPTSAPTALARPNDLPTDGACEEGRPCLGLLKPGTYHTELFEPAFAFTTTDNAWENLAMSPGNASLMSLDAPGDEIAFFAHPKPVKPDGSLDLSVKLTVDGITSWMTANKDLAVGPATDVMIGGLSGKQMDFSVAPDAVGSRPDCPAKTCINFLVGRDSTWAWDWGVASSEQQRMYVLAAKAGVVLIFVDSLDGTTFDTLTKAADTILATVTFDT